MRTVILSLLVLASTASWADAPSAYPPLPKGRAPVAVALHDTYLVFGGSSDRMRLYPPVVSRAAACGGDPNAWRAEVTVPVRARACVDPSDFHLEVAAARGPVRLTAARVSRWSAPSRERLSILALVPAPAEAVLRALDLCVVEFVAGPDASRLFDGREHELVLRQDGGKAGGTAYFPPDLCHPSGNRPWYPPVVRVPAAVGAAAGLSLPCGLLRRPPRGAAGGALKAGESPNLSAF